MIAKWQGRDRLILACTNFEAKIIHNDSEKTDANGSGKVCQDFFYHFLKISFLA